MSTPGETAGNPLTDDNAGQYGSSERLAARARLASQYTVSGEPWFAFVARNLPMTTGDRILDVGCGPAWFWGAVGEAVPVGMELTLADLSPGMVAEATRRCAGLPFSRVDGRVCDASVLPFADGEFDGAIAMHMLYHLADPAVAVAEMHRVLKPGGFLAVTTNGADNMRRLYELTTTFGGTPYDPAAAAFGFAEAERVLNERFGHATTHLHPASLRITDPDDVFLALTSYPPGDQADEHQLAAFRDAIRSAFADGDGALVTAKETGLFVAVKG